MKIALYIEDGREQIALTPETETERWLIAKLHELNTRVVNILKGEFYACQGGWSRHGTGQQSTLIVIDRKPAEQ